MRGQRLCQWVKCTGQTDFVITHPTKAMQARPAIYRGATITHRQDVSIEKCRLYLCEELVSLQRTTAGALR